MFNALIEPILIRLGYAPDALSQEQVNALKSIERISVKPKRNLRSREQVADVYLSNVLLGTAHGSMMEYYGERERLVKNAECRYAIEQIETRCYPQRPKPAELPKTEQAYQSIER